MKDDKNFISLVGTPLKYKKDDYHQYVELTYYNLIKDLLELGYYEDLEELKNE